MTMIAKQNILTLTFVVSILTTCGACGNSSQQTKNESQIMSIDMSEILTNIQEPKDTIIYDYTFFPTDSIYITKVLTTGEFHNDEIWDNVENEEWFGLFKNEKGFYLSRTKIKTKNVFDPILDKENEKTGWEVSTINQDTCLILIESLSCLSNREVQDFKFVKEYIYPGDTLTFKYLGVDYKLFATGGKEKVQEDSEWFEVWNYKLYLTADIKGQKRKSLLVAQPNFDDQMINLIFAGDIDGDGILDLIIDTSRHYNVTSPTIYLSKPADNGEIVKPIGGHTSVGC